MMPMEQPRDEADDLRDDEETDDHAEAEADGAHGPRAADAEKRNEAVVAEISASGRGQPADSPAHKTSAMVRTARRGGARDVPGGERTARPGGFERGRIPALRAADGRRVLALAVPAAAPI